MPHRASLSGGGCKGNAWWAGAAEVPAGLFLHTVGEEDEVSIREAAEAVVEAMDFHGEVTVSLVLLGTMGLCAHWRWPLSAHCGGEGCGRLLLL